MTSFNNRHTGENAAASSGRPSRRLRIRRPAFEAASSLKEEPMNALSVAASVVLVFVLAIFAIISILGLMGPDSRRW